MRQNKNRCLFTEGYELIDSLHVGVSVPPPHHEEQKLAGDKGTHPDGNGKTQSQYLPTALTPSLVTSLDLCSV